MGGPPTLQDENWALGPRFSEQRLFKAHPALTPFPKACHTLRVTGWRALGFRTAWNYPVSAIVAQSGPARPRQGINPPDSARHNRFWLAAHVESTRRDMQEGRGLKVLCSSGQPSLGRAGRRQTRSRSYPLNLRLTERTAYAGVVRSVLE